MEEVGAGERWEERVESEWRVSGMEREERGGRRGEGWPCTRRSVHKLNVFTRIERVSQTIVWAV